MLNSINITHTMKNTIPFCRLNSRLFIIHRHCAGTPHANLSREFFSRIFLMPFALAYCKIPLKAGIWRRGGNQLFQSLAWPLKIMLIYSCIKYLKSRSLEPSGWLICKVGYSFWISVADPTRFFVGAVDTHHPLANRWVQKFQRRRNKSEKT